MERSATRRDYRDRGGDCTESLTIGGVDRSGVTELPGSINTACFQPSFFAIRVSISRFPQLNSLIASGATIL